MNERLFEFVPSVFVRVLAATLWLLLLGWLGSIWHYGEMTPVDMAGSLICAPIFAYLVHLWIVYARDGDAGR